MPTAVQKITLSASRDIPFNKLVLNFGESKGRGFDHVVILPTGPMQKWLADPDSNLAAQSRAKFYVATTRARHSVAIAMDWKSASPPAGFSFYERPAT